MEVLHYICVSGPPHVLRVVASSGSIGAVNLGILSLTKIQARTAARQVLRTALACGLLLLLTQSGRAQVVDWLPDIVVRQSDLYNNEVATDILPGRTHLRFSTSTANIGMGRLHLIGILPALPDNTQLVMQRVFRSDGTYWDDTSGAFLYHSTHSHTHFNNWCAYRLRQILPGDSVGAVVAEGEKTSFCILDLGVYNSSLPNYNPNAFYTSCGSQVQGLSVGWLDLYSKNLPGQNIDITDVPNGQYWLEAEVDPDNNVLETNENNNITRIKVTLGGGSTIAADYMEPNDSIAQVLGHLVGQPNSPNLGPVGPRITLPALSVHLSGNSDYFRFYSAGTGTSSDSVRIDFSDAAGDLDMRLRDGNGTILVTSDGTIDREVILLSGRPAGWYYVQVYGYQNVTNPSYTLIINPASNTPPNITVVNPPSGIVTRAHGFENYIATWTSSDPNSDPTWVTVWVNTSPVLDGAQILLEGSLNTPGVDGYHIINSAAVPPGVYWVYCQITDGGTFAGDWSDGQIEFVTSFDSDFDGVYDYADNCIGWSNPGQEPGCTHHADPQADGIIDVFDVVKCVEIAFRNEPPIVDSDCPHGAIGRTDLNCDGATDILDVTLLVDVAFRGVTPDFCDPCECGSYPTGCP